MKLKHITTIIFVIIFSFLNLGIAPAQTFNDDTLVISTPLQPISLDPAVAADDASGEVCRNIYETLVRIDAKTGQILPHLAASFSSNSNYTKWYFTLRKDVFFCDGSVFDAQSVKFSLERQRNFKNPYHYPQYGYFSYYAANFNGFPGSLQKIIVTDKHKIEFVFDKPMPYFLDVLSLPQFSIVSPAAVKKHKDGFTENPAGTGPYKVVSWVRSSRIVLAKNDNYWSRKPFINKFIIQIVLNHGNRLSLLERGYSDIMQGVEVNDLDRLKNPNKYKMIQYPYAFDVILGINCGKFPFNNKKTREAVKYILSQDILDSVSLFEPVSPGTNYKKTFIENKKNSVNYVNAQDKLIEAGYNRNSPVELICPDAFPLYASNTSSIMGKIKFLLKECGFNNVKTKILPWDKFNEQIARGNYNLALLYTDLKNKNERLFDLTYFNQQHPVKYNLNKFHLFSNALKQILGDITDLSNTYNEESLLEELDYYIGNNAPYVFLGRLKSKILCSKRIEGLRFDNNGYLLFDRVYIK